jgi:hypothetical protein
MKLCSDVVIEPLRTIAFFIYQLEQLLITYIRINMIFKQAEGYARISLRNCVLRESRIDTHPTEGENSEESNELCALVRKERFGTWAALRRTMVQKQ